MSASPAGGMNGQGQTPPKPPPLRRRPQTNNPLVPRRKPQPRPAAVHAPGTPLPAAAKNAPVQSARPQPSIQQKQPNFEELRKRNDGWSFALPEGAHEYNLVLTKKSLREGLRFHVMKFAPPHQRLGQQGIDPTDQNEFTRPVYLNRRDPRQPPPGREVKQEIQEQTPEQSEETERLAQLKADREAQRAIDDAQKAPVMRENVKKNQKQKEKKEGTKARFGARGDKQKKEWQISYEEALPWHLEDADGKNVWVGQYEAPLSDAKIAFMIDGNKFRMVPMEKWYRFSSKRAGINAMSIEEAEKQMSKAVPVARWAMRDQKRQVIEEEMEKSRRLVNGPAGVKQESSTFKTASRKEKMEHDDIDMNLAEEFQDDDETPGFEADRDEDSKDAQARIRREQMNANLFGDADESKVDKEELIEKKEEDLEKELGRGMRKALKKRDKQFQYDSDDSDRERNPFAPSSDESESDSDDEDEKEGAKGDKDKQGASGVSSKGTNTPQGKKAASEAAKKGKSLKRPGSPMASDSSGTESTRKKKKKVGPSTSSIAGSRSSTPVPGGRSRTGPGSDGEATGGEMSDGAGGKKRKGNRLGTGTGARGTPTGSRAGSPVPANGGSISPIKGGASTPRSPVEPITATEIWNMLPMAPDGYSVGELFKLFGGRIGPEPPLMPRHDWIKLVKDVSIYDGTTKLLSRNPTYTGQS